MASVATFSANTAYVELTQYRYWLNEDLTVDTQYKIQPKYTMFLPFWVSIKKCCVSWNCSIIATLANEIFTVLKKIFVKFQTSNVYLKKTFSWQIQYMYIIRNDEMYLYSPWNRKENLAPPLDPPLLCADWLNIVYL
jgi:hypothetical protein